MYFETKLSLCVCFEDLRGEIIAVLSPWLIISSTDVRLLCILPNDQWILSFYSLTNGNRHNSKPVWALSILMSNHFRWFRKHTYDDQHSAEYLRRSFTDPHGSLFVKISPWFSVLQTQVALVSPDPQLYLFKLRRLSSFAWLPAPYAVAWKHSKGSKLG